jgi:hypothetical protein
MRGRRDKLTRNHKRKLISDKHVQWELSNHPGAESGQCYQLLWSDESWCDALN